MTTPIAPRQTGRQAAAVTAVIIATVATAWTLAGAFYIGTILCLCLLGGALAAARWAGTSVPVLLTALLVPGVVVLGFFAIIFGGGGLVPPD
jgi:hypothetical protein